MKNPLKSNLLAVCSAMSLLAALQARAIISIDIVNTTGNDGPTSGEIHFVGDGTFYFADATTGPNAGYAFIVNGVVGGNNSAFGDRGHINGTFTIGAINAGPPESAPVTSSPGANIHILDGFGGVFQGNINWITLTRSGTGGDLNLLGLINLTGITYTGTEQDWIDLRGSTDTASATVAFSFNPPVSIQALKTTHLHTSWTGDLTSVPGRVPDGGSSLILLGMALGGLMMFARSRKH